MMEHMKGLLKAVFLLIGGGMLGVLLLCLAYCLPVQQEHQTDSYAILEKEGWYPVMPILSKEMDTYFHSYLPGVLDDSTDRIMLTTALDDNTLQEGVLERAMRTYSTYMGEYSYYWHGYVTILRPLLCLMDYGELRILNGLLQILLIMLLAHMLWQRKGVRYALLLLTSYVLLMPLAVSVSLQYTWVFYIATASTLLMIARQDYFEQKNRYLYLFLVIGMLTSYFDLLTYPLFTWGFPLVWWLLLRPEEAGKEHPLRNVWVVVQSGLVWIAGYAVMWIQKWCYANVILGKNVFETAMEEVFLRSGTGETSAYQWMDRLEAVYVNWKHYEYTIYFLSLAVWLLWFLYRSLRYGWSKQWRSPALLLIGCSGVVWCLVLANHTQGHHFFTYRILGVSVLSILALLISSVDQESVPSPHRSLLGMGIAAGGWGILCVAAFGLACLAQEEIGVINGGLPSRQVLLPQGSVLEVPFTPTFSQITTWTAVFTTESAEGIYEIRILDQEGEVCRLELPVAELDGKTSLTREVDWRLQRGKEYTMQISTQGTTAELYIIVTEPGYTGLNEYGPIMISGEPVEGQPVTGLSYRTRVQSKRTLLFLTMTWLGILAACAVTGKSVWGMREKNESPGDYIKEIAA